MKAIPRPSTSSEGRTDPQPESTADWATAVAKLAETYDASFANARSTQYTNWRKAPFGTNITESLKQIAVPSAEPKESEKLTVSLFLEICSTAGFKLEFTPEQDGSVWTQLYALDKHIKGIVTLLRTKNIGPVENIPKDIKDGYEYALWWAFCKATRNVEGNAFCALSRKGTLVSAAGPWAGATMTRIVNQVGVITRFACESICERVKNVGSCLKGEGFFLQKLVGAKPQAGLYTVAELSLVQEDWAQRRDHVQQTYLKYKDMSWSKMVESDRLSAVMSAFLCKKNSVIQKIEEAVKNRIPQLLVTSGKGKKQQTSICKGSTLEDKISAVVPKPRTVALLMWSPLSGLKQAPFADIVMKLARCRLIKNLQAINQFETELKANNAEAWKVYSANKAIVEAAIDLVITIHSNNSSEPSWSPLGA